MRRASELKLFWKNYAAYVRILHMIGQMNELIYPRLVPAQTVIEVSKYEYNRIKRLLDLKDQIDILLNFKPPECFLLDERN